MIQEISTRVFRDDLAEYLDGSNTLAITRHGQIVGYYVPARDPSKVAEQIRIFQQSATRLQAALDASGFGEQELESVVEEFQQRKRKS
jgi:hypothetical protein